MSRTMRYALILVGAAMLGLSLWLPLGAQETAPSPPAAPEKPAPSEEEDAKPLAPGESVSADNNISFPVDI